ncbi:hypothetical protein [Hymenobacter terrenus]|uniref:hypothetical protein n=1 Tax=Hymenobacter terrenus TaxID=1629124 RepID=UPI0006192EBD|nr:hypothetical protein [Hymenobacter terrenus]
MKKLIWLLALAGTACQQQAPATQVAAATAARRPAAPRTSRPGTFTPRLPALFTPADTLTGSMRELLRQHDLSKLWQNGSEERKINPTLEGFFGPDHYRFALVFNEVRRDAQRPDIYHVRGKSHYRKNIRSFSGLLTVRQIVDLPRGYFFMAGAGAELPDTAAAYTYTARAQFQITEENSESSGVFEGEAVLDFYTLPNPATADYVTAVMGTDERMPARGCGLLLRGSRLNKTTKQVKKFVVATDVFAAAPDIYKDFAVGDRGGEINPKYAKLGWNEAWENEEWWADSPQPSLNL